MYEVVSARVRLRCRQEVCLAGPGWGLAGPGGAWRMGLAGPGSARRGLGGAWWRPVVAWRGLAVPCGGLAGPTNKLCFLWHTSYKSLIYILHVRDLFRSTPSLGPGSQLLTSMVTIHRRCSTRFCKHTKK